MPKESNTITIAGPAGDVFAFLADAENDRQWRGGVIEMTRTSGQGVGATYRQVVAGPGGRRIGIHCRAWSAHLGALHVTGPELHDVV